MSGLFGASRSTLSAPAVRRKLLVKTSAPEQWSDLLQSIASEWDVTWALDDEQFSIELSQGTFPVAAIDISDENFISSTVSSRSFVEVDDPLCMPRFQADKQVIPSHSTTFLLLRNEPSIQSLSASRQSQDITFLAEIRPQIATSDFFHWLDVAFGLTQLRAETSQLQRRLANRRSPIIGHSPQAVRLREQVATSAPGDWPILIQGEPGTGRDLVARAIHEASDRAHRPFVKIDCRVHSSTSLGRELFGHAAGIFQESGDALSNAPRSLPPGFESADHSSIPGRFDLADGGVLLIDGIDEIALPLQAVLAQVLHRKLYQRMGERSESPFNVRLIAITTKDLVSLSEAGQFREDLLGHFPGPVIKTPVLREIRSDISTLAENLLHRISSRLGCGPIRLMMESLTRLQAYDWPGNIAELEALLERACLLHPGGKLTVEMVDAWLMGDSQSSDMRLPGMTLAQMERQLIEATFTRCAGNRELTAHSLQIGLRTLSGKLRDYGYPPRGGPGSNRMPQVRMERDAA